MSIPTAETGRLSPPVATPHRGESIIDRQLGRTGSRIKLLELAAWLAVLAAGIIGALLAAAIVDHWLLPLNTIGRLLGFVAIAGAAGWVLVARVAPLVLRPINPLYAARQIERAEPSLKNSLVNFLQFRTARTQVREVVYDALEQRAASDIARTPVETAIDGQVVVRRLAVLAAVAVAALVYEAALPKQAWRTAARVLAPWADIDRPARVAINLESLTPGDAEVFRGDRVVVSAAIRGLRSGETPHVVYSAVDGRVVDLREPLQPTSETGRYEATIPPPPGVQFDVVYRIVAGDAETRPFRLHMSPTPQIRVEEIAYEPPRYTRLPAETTIRQGEVRALEGTRVTIRARANRPLGSAWLEFDPDPAAPATAAPPVASATQLPLEVAGDEGTVSFRLELQADRRTPKRQSYWLRMVSADGHADREPVLHRLEVLPDLAPEIAVLQPTSRRLELPEDAALPIELRAIDPDFALSDVRLKFAVRGETRADVALLPSGDEARRQVTVTHRFAPRALGLRAGAEVIFWGEAADNRELEPTRSPAPNTARTANYTVRITPSERRPMADEESSAGDAGDESSSDPRAGQPPGDGQQPGQPQDQPSDPSGGENGAGESRDGQQPGPQDGQGSDPGQPQPGQPDAAAGDNGGLPSEQVDQVGDGTGDERNRQGTSSGGPMGGEQQSESGQASGAGDGAQGQAQNEQGAPGGEREPVANDGSDDGSAFERIQQFLQEQEKQAGADAAGGASEGGAGQRDPQATGDQGTGTGRAAGEQPGEGAAPSDQRPQGAGDTQQAAGSAAGEQPAGSDPAASQRPPGDPGQQQPGAGQPRQPGAGEQRPGEPADAGASQQPMPGQPGDQAADPQAADPSQRRGDGPLAGDASGQPGGDPRGADQTRPEQGADARQPADQKTPGQGQTGESGAGRDQPTGQGAPESQGEGRDRPKTQQPTDQQGEETGEPPSTSISPRQSDSEGESGDRSGGGGPGGGQGAKLPGQDKPGSTTAADEGAGAAAEQGSGDTSTAAGRDQQADGATGEAGSEPGQGSTGRQAPGGEGIGESTGQPGEGQQPGQAAGQGTGDRAGPVRGGGAPGSLDPADAPTGDVPPAEQVNLDYARQATDLVLEKLSQQQDQPDQELLDRLGWTKDDMARFLDRWRQLRDAARQEGAAGEAQRELDQALRSLGLRPQADSVRRGAGPTDEVRGVIDRGGRTRPPSEYQRLYDAFRKGVDVPAAPR